MCRIYFLFQKISTIYLFKMLLYITVFGNKILAKIYNIFEKNIRDF